MNRSAAAKTSAFASCALAAMILAQTVFAGPDADPPRTEAPLVKLINGSGHEELSEAEILARSAMRFSRSQRSDVKETRRRLVQELQEVLAVFREKVPELAHIRARPSHLNRMILRLSPALFASVSGNFKDGATEVRLVTGNSAFDALNSEYGLREVQLSSASGLLVANFESLDIVVVAIAKYRNIEGVEYAELDRLVGDGPELTVHAEGSDGWIITARDAWGDCLTGCIHSQIYQFAISNGVLTRLTEKPAEKPASRPRLVPSAPLKRGDNSRQ